MTGIPDARAEEWWKRWDDEPPPPPLTEHQKDVIAAAFRGAFIRQPDGRLTHADGTPLHGPGGDT
jgi:hypothetical protein